MTKKAEKILKEYEKKLNQVEWMYNREFYNEAQRYQKMREETKEYQNMISGMLHFNMLSSSDFSELWEKSIGR